MSYTAESFEEALQEFQKEFAYRIHTILVRSGWNLPPQSNIALMGTKDGENRWGEGYFHIDFKPLIPIQVNYFPVSSVILDRTPGRAAERIYRNFSYEDPSSHGYVHQKDSALRKLSGIRNMQGLEISNQTTVGTGEAASVKLENSTTLTVKAEFEQASERETTETESEIDTTDIDVGIRKAKRVFQARWESRIKEISEKHMVCDVAFDVYAHRKRIGDGIYPNPGYRKTGADARKALSITSTADVRNIFKGISAPYKNMRKDWIASDKVISDNINWITKNATFVKVEESIFEQSSYGEVQISDIALEKE